MASDWMSNAAEIDRQLEKCYEAIESDSELKSKVNFILQRRTGKTEKIREAPRYYKRLRIFQGPDSATLDVMAQKVDDWASDPSSFTQRVLECDFTTVSSGSDANLIYLALRYIRAEHDGTQLLQYPRWQHLSCEVGVLT